MAQDPYGGGRYCLIVYRILWSVVTLFFLSSRMPQNVEQAIDNGFWHMITRVDLTMGTRTPTARGV